MASQDVANDQEKRDVSRRQVLQSAGIVGVGATLAGCTGGNSGNDSTNKSANNAGNSVKWGVGSTVADNGEKIKKLLHDSGLSKDISIEFIPGAVDTGKRQNKYTQILKSGQASPDMFMMDVGWTIPFVAREQLLNLSDALSNSEIKTLENDYFESSVSTSQSKNGDHYGVPFFPGLGTMQYRKDLVKKAGYKPDKKNWATNPMSWEKFSKITEDIQKQTNTEHGFLFQFDSFAGLACCTFNEFMSSWGGAYFGGRKHLNGPVNKRPVTVAKEPVINAIKMVRTFINSTNSKTLSDYASGISPVDVLSWQEQDTLSAMQNEQAVMLRYWPQAIAQLANEENFGTDYGVMPMPYAVSEDDATESGTGGSTAALGGWNLTVNPNSNNTEAALEVIRTTMTDQFQLGFLDIAGRLPPKPELFNSRKAKKQKPIGRYLDTLRFAGENSMPRPVTVAWPQESTQIYQKVNNSAKNDSSPKKIMEDLSGEIKSIEESVGSS